MSAAAHEEAADEPAARPPRWGRFFAGSATLLFASAACTAALAWSRGTLRLARADDAVSLAAFGPALGPFGEYAGPDLTPNDYRLGAKPKFGADWAALGGSPPWPYQPSSDPKKPPGCLGKGCNDGKLCCGSDAICCGTSCCSGGSICCDEKLGMCCAGGSMCCFGKMCCAPSWTCGRTRFVQSPYKWKRLEQCGSGAQFRRLVDKQAYNKNFRKLLAAENETALEEMLGIREQDSV